MYKRAIAILEAEGDSQKANLVSALENYSALLSKNKRFEESKQMLAKAHKLSGQKDEDDEE